MSTTAIDVAKYVRSAVPHLGEMQLHKLAYYAQAWSLTWDGRPLFEEPVEAWRMGPVVRALRHRRDEPDADALDERGKAVVDAVVAFYGKSTGAALGDRTHTEAPWRDVWEARQPANSTQCSDEIPHAAMRRFYTEAVLNGENVPHRRPVAEEVDRDEVLAIAAANAERWRETLAILAQ